MLGKKVFAVLFVLLYTAVYYLWLLFYDGSPMHRIMVSDILQTIPPLIVSALLFRTYRKSEHVDRFFLLHLFMGCFCYLVSQLAWDYYEIILGINNPAFGWYSILWAVSILSYIAAVTHKLNQERDGNWTWYW